MFVCVGVYVFTQISGHDQLFFTNDSFWSLSAGGAALCLVICHFRIIDWCFKWFWVERHSLLWDNYLGFLTSDPGSHLQFEDTN